MRPARRPFPPSPSPSLSPAGSSGFPRPPTPVSASVRSAPPGFGDVASTSPGSPPGTRTVPGSVVEARRDRECRVPHRFGAHPPRLRSPGSGSRHDRLRPGCGPQLEVPWPAVLHRRAPRFAASRGAGHPRKRSHARGGSAPPPGALDLGRRPELRELGACRGLQAIRNRPGPGPPRGEGGRRAPGLRHEGVPRPDGGRGGGRGVLSYALPAVAVRRVTPSLSGRPAGVRRGATP